MRSFYQVRLGRASIYAPDCLKNGFIGTSWFANSDLSESISVAVDGKAFNLVMIPKYLVESPETSKAAAALFCGFTYTVARGIQIGDVVLSPLGGGKYIAGEILSDYFYSPGSPIPHRRKIRWLTRYLESSEFSEALRNSLGTIGTVAHLYSYAVELDNLLSQDSPSLIYSTNEDVENASEFALEKHLEDFLVTNWSSTALGNYYDIFQEQGELVGQQYQTDTGPIDILAVSKDKKTLLVIELKEGRVSDVVVGQTHRYMGYIQEEIAEENQKVRGLIIGLTEDLKLKRALAVAPNIDFYRYQVNFKLIKGFKE